MSTILNEKTLKWVDQAFVRADKTDDVKTKVDEDGKYILTPWPLCDGIVGQISAQTSLKGKKILVVDTAEFIPVLLASGAEKCNITFVAPYQYKGSQIAGVIGVRVVQQSLLEWTPDMKFDIVVGNPPYNKGMLKGLDVGRSLAAGYPHLYMIEKMLAKMEPNGVLTFIIPAGLLSLFSLAKLRREILSKYHVESIKIYNNSGQKYFAINKFDNVVSIQIVNKPYTGQTHIEREGLNFQVNSTIADLRKFTFWPLYFDDTARSILEKVCGKKNSRGILYKKSCESEYYVSFAVMGDGNSYNHTKLWMANTSNPNISALIKIFFSTSEKATRYHAFTQTRLFNLLLSMTKSTPKNQPQFVDHIGDFDFTDNNFYAFFGFTPKEIEYIEAFRSENS